MPAARDEVDAILARLAAAVEPRSAWSDEIVALRVGDVWAALDEIRCLRDLLDLEPERDPSRPPFRPGEKVWTMWPDKRQWTPCVVERCVPGTHCESGWMVDVEGGLWASRKDELARPPKIGQRVTTLDAGWFRRQPPPDKNRARRRHPRAPGPRELS